MGDFRGTLIFNAGAFAVIPKLAFGLQTQEDPEQVEIMNIILVVRLEDSMHVGA